MPCLARRCLTEFYPTADDVLAADLERLGGALLIHLDSYEGRVKQHGRLYQGYLRDTLDNRNSGLGQMLPAPEYGPRQTQVTQRVMEAWYWLERQGLLIPDASCHGWHLISTEGKRRLAKLALFERCEKLGLDRVKSDLLNPAGIRDLGAGPEVTNVAWEWVRTKEALAPVPAVHELHGLKNREVVRRNQGYEAIDDALRNVAKAQPEGQKEVFESLDGRVKIPNAEPFKSAGGWMAGFRQNPAAARAWLSKRWTELNLPPLLRGPKNPKK